MRVKQSNATDALTELIRIVAQLRDPERGCPWDQKQSHQSLTGYLIEETYEVLEAISCDDDDALRDELGDVLFQIVLHSQIAAERQSFDLAAVIAGISNKMRRRHPHVFGNAAAQKNLSDVELRAQWARIKAEERQEQPEQPSTQVSAVHGNRPALHFAHALGAAAARHGFDWPDIGSVLEKISEEMLEIQNAKPETLEEEMGDLLFAAVQLCRKAELEPERVLHRASCKFQQRFAAMIALKDTTPDSLEEWEARWQKVKEQKISLS